MYTIGRIVNSNNIIVMNLNIEVSIEGEGNTYDTIKSDVEFRPSLDNSTMYISTENSYRAIKENLSNKYNLSVDLFAIELRCLNIMFEGKKCELRYTDIHIYFPEGQYQQWIIEQRDKTIDQILN